MRWHKILGKNPSDLKFYYLYYLLLLILILRAVSPYGPILGEYQRGFRVGR